jgi:hypothetical protein
MADDDSGHAHQATPGPQLLEQITASAADRHPADDNSRQPPARRLIAPSHGCCGVFAPLP